jgi:hypothetical protein
VQLYVETLSQGPGSEPTSGRIEDVGERVVEAFDKAQDAIVGVASKVAGAIEALAQRSIGPDELQVDFGLSFTVKGDLVVVGSSAEASLRISLTYKGDRAPTSDGSAATGPTAGHDG